MKVGECYSERDGTITQFLRTPQVVDVIVRLPLSSIEFRGRSSENLIRPKQGRLLGEGERFEGYSPGPLLLPGEAAVRCSTLYCYLFRLEYIFNPKPLCLFLLVLSLI